MGKNLLPIVNRFEAFSDSLTMSGNAIAVFDKYLHSLGDSYYFRFGGLKKTLITTDPIIVGHVLQKNYKNYTKSEIQTSKMGRFLGEGLLTSHGPHWLTQRRIIQEGFKKDKLRSYLNKMAETVDVNLEKVVNDSHKSVDLAQFLTVVSFEMVMSSLFTQRINQTELNHIAHTIQTVQKYILKQIVQPYSSLWSSVSGEYSRHQKNRADADRIILNLIRNRKQSKDLTADILDILLQARYEETGLGMTEQQVLMESMQLIVAGHETSSTSLLWTLYLLTQHPEVYRKVKAELDSMEEISMESLMGLSYTTQVIQESMRMYPPFWMIDRQALNEDQVNGHRIKKGTMVLIYVYGIHHSEKYWQQPEVFNPESFSRINPKKESPFTYLPFGAGPKGCIGGNYAMLQMLIILKKILSKFDISIDKKVVELSPYIILKPKDKILFNLTSR
jgi:cytochrome P450